MALMVFVQVQIYVASQLDGFDLGLLRLLAETGYWLLIVGVVGFSQLKCGEVREIPPHKNFREMR